MIYICFVFNLVFPAVPCSYILMSLLTAILHPHAAVQFVCYVMWNLFTVGSLQFCDDSTIASLEANQNQPKTKYYVHKYIKFLYFMYIEI